MTAVVGLLVLAVVVRVAIQIGRRAAKAVTAANRRIDADVAFIQAIPGGVEK